MSSETTSMSLQSGNYTWARVWAIVEQHRRELLTANVIAVFAVLVSVPLPLMMPLLVDEVLLKQPGFLVHAMDLVFPAVWHGAVLYISVILLLTVILRVISVMLSVWQTREFTKIAKDVVYRIRRDLLLRLQRISMAEYEAIGSGEVTSHFVTDLNAVDDFIGMTISKFIIAVLSLLGAAFVLLWMHWQLALLILFLNPVVV